MDMTKSEILRSLFKGDRIIRIVGAHDGLTAKLIEHNGFDGVWASGLEVSASYAVPDANILTMLQYLERACEANDATSIPVIADCDTGYGNSSNVIYMVRKYESAGVAAVCIEDKRFPKVNSLLSDSRQELAPIAEFVGKITAAKNAQASEAFMVIARVEALIAGLGEKEALLRAEKYVEAGADAILIHSKADTYEEILSFAKKWDKRVPLVIVPTTYPSILKDLSDKELLGLGIKMVIFANHCLRSSVAAINQTLAEIKREGGPHTIEKDIATLEEIFHLQGMVDFKEQEKKYLKSENEDVVVVIPAAGKPVGQGSMAPLLRDRPLCMVDINGKSLLERDLDVLKMAGIRHIYIIIGYKKEYILERTETINPNDDISLIVNREFDSKHILHSIMLAEDNMNDRCLIVYSDILFDRDLVEKLLRSRHDIVLVGDNTYKRYGKRNKKLDLIKVAEPAVAGKREIVTDKLLTVKKIGKNIKEKEADFEFIGMAYFSRTGIKEFKALYRKIKAAQERKKGIFHEAKNFNEISLTDMLQEAIDNGLSVRLLPVNSGWTEIHEFNDYRFACKNVKGLKAEE
jgi:phosphoenolpyruvate phosphomutase